MGFSALADRRLNKLNAARPSVAEKPDTVKFWVRETLFFPLEYAKISSLN
mgnify:CR=1 FL=1